MGQISDLCKSGRFEEAYALGKQLCDENPNIIGYKHELSWACYYIIKSAIDSGEDRIVAARLRDIANLELGIDKIGEYLVWQIVKWINRSIAPVKDANDRFKKLKFILDLLPKLSLPVPSEGYSTLVKMLHRASKDLSEYCDIIDCIGFDFLRSDDYLPLEVENVKYPPLAEQMYTTYSKCLIELLNSSNKADCVKERVYHFIPLLDDIIKTRPEYQYTIYHKVKLLLTLGVKGQIAELLAPFVRKKSKLFWVWQVLGESVSETDKQLALSCFSRALLCDSQSEYLVSLREQMARLMADMGFYAEARCEIDSAERTRADKGWKLTEYILSVKQQSWYKKAQIISDNHEFYKKHSDNAESFLYARDAQPVLITYVNEGKKIANFMLEDDRIGFFTYKRLQITPTVGNVYKMVLSYSEKSISNVRWLSEWDASWEDSPFYKEVHGVIKIPAGKQFGFIEDMYVSPKTIELGGLTDGMMVHGIAVRGYDRKKEVFGWRISSAVKEE